MNSPYTRLSDYLKARFNQKVYKITVNAGLTCPNRDGTKGVDGCTYCQPASLMPLDSDGAIPVSEQLLKGAERIKRRHRAGRFIAYFQINTNTYGPVGLLKELYGPAMDHPDVVALAISTRPDCLGDEVLNLLVDLKKEKHVWIELGLQTANDETLRAVNRGHSAAEFKDAAIRAHAAGLGVVAHVILGLPNEDRADALATMRFLAAMPVWGIKFHQLQVMRGTALERQYLEAAFKCLTLEQYANLVIECLECLPKRVVVHRLSGDSPEHLLVAPKWSANKFMIIEYIERLMRERKTFQGKRFTGPDGK